jgi:hypothetical protein
VIASKIPFATPEAISFEIVEAIPANGFQEDFGAAFGAEGPREIDPRGVLEDKVSVCGSNTFIGYLGFTMLCILKCIFYTSEKIEKNHLRESDLGRRSCRDKRSQKTHDQC